MPESRRVRQQREQPKPVHRRPYALDMATRPIPKNLQALAFHTPDQLLFDADGQTVEPWRNFKRTLPLVLGTVVDSSVKWRLTRRAHQDYALPESVQSFFSRNSRAVSVRNQKAGAPETGNQPDGRNVARRLQKMTGEIDHAITLELLESIPALRQQYYHYLNILNDSKLDSVTKEKALQQITAEMVWVDSVKALPSPKSVMVFESLLTSYSRLQEYGVDSPHDFAQLVRRMAHESEFSIVVNDARHTAEELFSHGQKVYRRLKRVIVSTSNGIVTERKTSNEQMLRDLANKEEVSDLDFIALLFVLSRMYSQLVSITYPPKKRLLRERVKRRNITTLRQYKRQKQQLIRERPTIVWDNYIKLVRTRHRSMMKAAAIADMVCLVPTHKDAEKRQHLLVLAHEAKPLLRQFLSNTSTLQQRDVLVLQQLLQEVLAGNMMVAVVELKTHLIQPPQLRTHDWHDQGNYFRPHGMTAELTRDVTHTLFALLTSMATVARDPRARPVEEDAGLEPVPLKLAEKLRRMRSDQHQPPRFMHTDTFARLMNGISADTYAQRHSSEFRLQKMLSKLVKSGQIGAYVAEAHAPFIQRHSGFADGQPDTFSLVDDVFLPPRDDERESVVYVTNALLEYPSASDVVLGKKSAAPRIRKAMLRAFKTKPAQMERMRVDARQLEECRVLLEQSIGCLDALASGNLTIIDQRYQHLQSTLNALPWSNKNFLQMKVALLGSVDPSRTLLRQTDYQLTTIKKQIVEILLAYLPNRRARSAFAQECEHIVPNVTVRIIGGQSHVRAALVGLGVQPPVASVAQETGDLGAEDGGVQQAGGVDGEEPKAAVDAVAG